MNRLVVRRELALRGYDVVRSVRRLRHAFANPEAAFLSAVHLLCAPAGRWDPDTSGPGRATFASTLYEELRDLWMRERAFDGGLLDVHTVLSMLGPHGYPGATWAEAVNPHLVGQLVCEYEASHQDLHVAHACAAHLARRFLDASRPDAPLHALTLEQYGYGQSRSFCWMVEHGTRDYVAISIGNASAHEVGRGAKRGAWCIRGSEGHTQEEAAQFFAQQVKPRLEEIAASACAFLDGRPTPPLTAAKLQTYRHLDAKTFCLLVSGRDEDAAHVRLVPVVSRVRLATLSRLLGAEPLEIHGFADYVEVQHRLGRALRRLPENVRPSADGLAKWSYDDPRGKVLCALLEGAAQREGAEEPADHTTSERALDDAIASTAAALPAPPADLPDAGLLGQLDDERRVDPVHTPLRPDLLHGGRELVEQVGAARPSTLLSTLNDPLLLLGCGPLSSSGGRGAPGWSVDKAAAFQRLVEQGRIERVGSGGPGTYYRLPAAAPLLVTPSQPLISETTLH